MIINEARPILMTIMITENQIFVVLVRVLPRQIPMMPVNTEFNIRYGLADLLAPPNPGLRAPSIGEVLAGQDGAASNEGRFAQNGNSPIWTAQTGRCGQRPIVPTRPRG